MAFHDTTWSQSASIKRRVLSASLYGWLAIAFIMFSPWLNAQSAINSVNTASTRVPAYPLITHDPYFSIWSFTDQLAGEWTRHWTGATNAMTAMVRVDSSSYRLMGMAPSSVPAMTQKSVIVTATKTTYTFAGAGIELHLIFMSPVIAGNLDLVSRPVSYVTFAARATDGKPHTTAFYFDNSAELVVANPNQQVTWSHSDGGAMKALTIGTTDQRVLGAAGDRITIDWGYLYQAVGRDADAQQVIGGDVGVRNAFATTGTIPVQDDERKPRAANDNWPVLATSFAPIQLGAQWQARFLMLAYDDIYSVEYMNQRLVAYWHKYFKTMTDLLEAATTEYATITQKSDEFDANIASDARATGGQDFVLLTGLAYRQSIAAHKIVMAADGTPYTFSKENSSNGCMATVDVTFPSAPLYLLLNPTLLKGMLTPIYKYAASPHWKFPFAPHDVGTYPLGNGQSYGGREDSETDQMPVEESGNMIILTAAIAVAEGNAEYARAYLPLLKRWAEYLTAQGFDPANQLSTDDFTGHLAHNVNLSAKAIVALGSYAKLNAMLGNDAEATKYHQIAHNYAAQWITNSDDGDHSRLAFDKAGTYSQKYNLAWDHLLNLGLFSDDIYQREVDYYKSKLNRYGVPLDSRASYTIVVWNVWAATLSQNRDDFVTLIAPLARFLRETPDRIPFTDWQQTIDGTAAGFQARSVVGGVYFPMLMDHPLWDKWLQKRE